MPSASDRMRNNVRAGLFVVVTLALTLAVVFVLSDIKQVFSGPATYVVTFPVEAGVQNLSGGADVRVGGISMGRVSVVRLVRPDHPDAPASTIEVVFMLDRDVRLYSNARVSVRAPLIGAEAWLDITSLGGTDLDPTALLLDEGEMLAGATGGTMLDSLLGPSAGRVNTILENVEDGTEFFADLGNLYQSDVKPILGNVDATTGDARALVEDLRHNRWPQWAEQISSVMTHANELTADLDSAVANANSLVQDGRDVIAENRGPLHETMLNLQSGSADASAITARVRAETIDKVHQLLATGQEGLDNAVDVLGTVRADYTGWSPRISEALTNATLTSQQLKLAGMEVRRNPWKLLYRPTTDELEHELLYEAARSFALAATDLKAASLAAERMFETYGDRLADEPELLNRVTENLIDPLEKYERAQTRLFDILKLEP